MAKKSRASGNVRAAPQRIMIEYAKTLIVPVVERLMAAGIEYEMAGEIRRELPEVRSAILLCNVSRSELLDVFPEATPAVTQNWICRISLDDFPCYLCSALPEEWGAKMIFLTGPWTFRSHICRFARDAGFKLNYRGLWRLGTRYAGRTEQQIFDILDMPFIDGPARTTYKKKHIRKPDEEEVKKKNVRGNKRRTLIGVGYRFRKKKKKRRPGLEADRDPSTDRGSDDSSQS